MPLLFESCPALVLNADYRPLCYFPLSLWQWQDVVKSVFLGKVTVLCVYDHKARSPRAEMALPSVISLKNYVPPVKFPVFSRFNLFLRDGFVCQYCNENSSLTFDHLVPRSRGGRTTWENVVAACASCNLRKGQSLVKECGMFPRKNPRRPSFIELHNKGRKFPPNSLHESWRDFLYWDVELEA